MEVVLVKSKHAHRGVVALGVLEDVVSHPDVPASMKTGLQAVLDTASDKEAAGGVIVANLKSKSVMNDLGWGKVWWIPANSNVLDCLTDAPAPSSPPSTSSAN
ncbi:MAG: hypothetical protein HY318_20900 [Armatimonadetes bacterium]|nr:hypothetical protein [Armatimonadota bacterium]